VRGDFLANGMAITVERDRHVEGHVVPKTHGGFRRTTRVTERRREKPTIPLDPTAASVHPMVRRFSITLDENGF
jgi:hypothetical protein